MIYILECGHGANDLRDMFGGEQFEGLRKSDTPEEEAKKTLRARESLEIQSTFMRGLWCQCRVLLQERELSEHGDTPCSGYPLRMSTTIPTHGSNASDLAKCRQLPRPLIIRLF